MVLIARAKAPAKLARAVRAAGGEVHEFEAPKARDMPRVLLADAKRLGFRLEPAAARALVERIGTSPLRLAHELQRLALWAGPGGEVTAADLEAMVTDTSEAAVWTLSDALLERDPARALEIGERLIGQGESVTGLVYGLASRLRSAFVAAAQLEEGVPAQADRVRAWRCTPMRLGQLLAASTTSSLAICGRATATLADLEVWCRGGADYGDDLALTLARAGGAVGDPV